MDLQIGLVQRALSLDNGADGTLKLAAQAFCQRSGPITAVCAFMVAGAPKPNVSNKTRRSAAYLVEP